MVTGENNLSFIETSALDASNVELAFQNILTGKSPLSYFHVFGISWLTKTSSQKSSALYQVRHLRVAILPQTSSATAKSWKSPKPQTLRRNKGAVDWSNPILFLCGHVGCHLMCKATMKGTGGWSFISWFSFSAFTFLLLHLLSPPFTSSPFSSGLG